MTKLEMALRLAKNGWPIFPVHPGAKHPLGKLAPNGFKDATTGCQKIKDWWRVVPSANIGVATGPVFVIDLDVKNGVDGIAAWKEIVGGRHLPETLIVNTPSGGKHLYFRTPEGIEVKCSAGRIADGIDVRGNGGYVVYPPSKTETGAYTFSRNVPVAPAPKWLISPLKDDQNGRAERAAPTVEGIVPNGQRNDTLASLAGTMRHRGMSYAAIEAALKKENELRCSPPLPDDEVECIAASIARYEPEGGEASEGSEHASWEQPIPLRKIATHESLPLEAFPDWAASHIQSVADALQVPSDLPVLLALTTMGGASQKKVVVEIRPGWTEPLSLWGVAVLESGTRKSAAFKLMVSPIEEYEAVLQKQTSREYVKAKDQQEVLEKRLERAKKTAEKASAEDRDAVLANVRMAREELENHSVPRVPQLWIDDTTSEALLQILAENNGRMLAMSAEGDLFKYMTGRYSKGPSVLNTYKKSWSGEEAVRDNRITRESTSVSNPALSIGICAQPQVLEDLTQKRTFRGEGLLARFLWVVPSSNVGYRTTGLDVPELDLETKAEYDRRIKRIWQLDPKDSDGDEWVPHTLRLDAAARRVLSDFESEVETMLRDGGRLEGLKDWGSKLVGQAVRIAGVLHIAHFYTPESHIGRGTMEAAIDLARSFIPHAKAAYDLLNANEQNRIVRYVWRRICEKHNGHPAPQNTHNPQNPDSGNNGDTGSTNFLTKRDVWQMVRGKNEISSVHDLDPILRQLEAHHLIRVVDRKTKGPGRPPSPIILVNPLVDLNEL